MEKPKIGDYIVVPNDRIIDNGPWDSKIIDIQGDSYKVAAYNDRWYEIKKFINVSKREGTLFFAIEEIFLEIKSDIPLELVKQYVKARMKGIGHRAALLILDDKLGRKVTKKEAEALITVFEKEYYKKLMGELTTSDNIPDRLGVWEPVELKKKRDKLYQKRLKQNPDLKNNIKKIGESMKTVVTYKSDNASAISRQWHLMFHIDDKSWNSWDISDIKSKNNTHMFTLTSYQTDNRLTQKDLESSLIAGVDMTITKGRNESKDNEDSILSLLELDLSAEEMAEILLKDDPKVESFNEASNYKDSLGEVYLSFKKAVDQMKSQKADPSHIKKAEALLNKFNKELSSISLGEAEVPDDEDAESNTIDDVQTMLTKMLPKTKGLKLDPEKEKELKMHVKKAMSLMGESNLIESYTARITKQGSTDTITTDKSSSESEAARKAAKLISNKKGKFIITVFNDKTDKQVDKFTIINESLMGESRTAQGSQKQKKPDEVLKSVKIRGKTIKPGDKFYHSQGKKDKIYKVTKLVKTWNPIEREWQVDIYSGNDVFSSATATFINESLMGEESVQDVELAQISNDLTEVTAKLQGTSALLKVNKLSPKEYEKVKKLKAFNKNDWKWDSEEEMYIKVKSSSNKTEGTDNLKVGDKVKSKNQLASTHGVKGKITKIDKVKLASGDQIRYIVKTKDGEEVKLRPDDIQKESVDYPQFQFAVVIPRDDYQAAAKILNDSNIDIKTRFASNGMAVLGFDYHNETGRGNPNVTENEILDILNNSGIAATLMDGSEFNNEPETLDIGEE